MSRNRGRRMKPGTMQVERSRPKEKVYPSSLCAVFLIHPDLVSLYKSLIQGTRVTETRQVESPRGLFCPREWLATGSCKQHLPMYTRAPYRILYYKYSVRMVLYSEWCHAV